MKPEGFIVFFLIFSIPLWISVWAIWRWRGAARIAAVIPLIIMLMALAIDIPGALQGGNLTGLATIAATVVSLLILLVLCMMQSLTGRYERPQSRVAAYTMSTLSALFVLTGILFVSYVGFTLPREHEFSQIENVVFWAVSGLVALAAAAYSFRRAVKPRTNNEQENTSTNTETKDGSKHG